MHVCAVCAFVLTLSYSYTGKDCLMFPQLKSVPDVGCRADSHQVKIFGLTSWQVRRDTSSYFARYHIPRAQIIAAKHVLCLILVLFQTNVVRVTKTSHN